VFLDLHVINWIPHNWTVNQLVHAEDSTSVRHVMIGGRQVVRDRMLTTVDLPRLAREAEAARDRLDAANAQVKALTEQLSVVVGNFCPGLAAAPYHVRRYVAE
jgi:5-methylthioadenosine/S-adenosylhomocysteine deaminase